MSTHTQRSPLCYAIFDIEVETYDNALKRRRENCECELFKCVHCSMIYVTYISLWKWMKFNFIRKQMPMQKTFRSKDKMALCPFIFIADNRELFITRNKIMFNRTLISKFLLVQKFIKATRTCCYRCCGTTKNVMTIIFPWNIIMTVSNLNFASLLFPCLKLCAMFPANQDQAEANN